MKLSSIKSNNSFFPDLFKSYRRIGTIVVSATIILAIEHLRINQGSSFTKRELQGWNVVNKSAIGILGATLFAVFCRLGKDIKESCIELRKNRSSGEWKDLEVGQKGR